MNFCEGFLEIRNQRKFLVGLIILILGSFVIVFDYPQIEYLNYLENDNSITLEIEQKEIFQKILIEFTIGVILLIIFVNLSFYNLINPYMHLNLY